MIKFILDLFFPKRCVGCKKFGDYFCKSCKDSILQGDLICPVCQKVAVGGQTHPICKRAYGLDGLWSLGLYKDPLRRAIIDLKYHFVKDLTKELLNLTLEYWARYQPFLLEQIKKNQGKGWIVVPVPLHEYRKNWRGFNQSEDLGQGLAKSLGLRYLEALKRKKYTQPQVKLKGEARRKNIKDVFSLNTKYIIRNTNILLIDDVWTTGSTLKECTYILKRAGAKQVWALTLAR